MQQAVSKRLPMESRRTAAAQDKTRNGDFAVTAFDSVADSS